MGPAPLPVIVGITGHRDPTAAGLAAVAGSLRAVLASLADACPGVVRVMSGLASGADLLAADVARELGLGRIAVAPMPVATYRGTLTSDADRARFDAHWQEAELRIELPQPRDDEAGYERLGALLARRSHVLIALWDGNDAEDPARGGVAHVVEMCLGGSIPATALQFARRSPRLLDLPERGCVLQLLTPRDKHAGTLAAPPRIGAQAGNCALLAGNAPVVPARAFAAIDAACQGGLGAIADFNRKIAAFGPVDRRVFDMQLGHLRTDGIADPDGAAAPPLARLRGWQATADAAAQHFQRRMLGVWVPASGAGGMFGNAWAHLRRHWRLPPPGVLFVFAMAVPFAVLFFELYAHPGHHPHWLFLYVLLFGGSLAYSRHRVEPARWQSRFQDGRALAEALRVQTFWALAGLPDTVADHYDRSLRGELGWIGFALRGPSLWALALAGALGAPVRGLVTQGWIADQRHFFIGSDGRSGKARLNAAAMASGERSARLFLGAGLWLTVAMAAIELARLALHALGIGLGFEAGVDEAVSALLVLAATAPALAAFFAVSVEKRAYEAHAHAYAAMGRLFDRALKLAEKSDEASFRSLVLELGEEALRENAEWLLDHRRRPIEHISK